jgi:hypothetical protein
LLRSDSFEAFLEDRQGQLLRLIEKATDKRSYRRSEREEGEKVEAAPDDIGAKLTMPAV